MKIPAPSLAALRNPALSFAAAASLLLLPRLVLGADDGAIGGGVRGATGGVGRALAPPADVPSNVFIVPTNYGGPVTKPGGNPNDGGDGGGGDVEPEIVGGVEVSPRRKYKFFVWLRGCGGSLVAPNVVLSAAHCRGVSSFVTLGMHKIALGPGESDEFLALEHIPIAEDVIHPNYSGRTYDNDYWVIRLQWASQLYANEVVVLDTPATDDGLNLDDGQPHELTVFGFGTLTSGGATPNVLQEVDVDYLPNNNCGQYPSGEITGNMLCAARAGKDSCQGDSGGPIIDKATQLLVGIVSWGYGCADPRYPGVYSRVSTGHSWIQSYINRWTDGSFNTAYPAPYAPCRDQGGFYDVDGVSYNCMWYAGGNNCASYGDRFAHAGVVANDACCACGGGLTGPTQSPTPSPTRSPTPPTPKPTTPAPTPPPTVNCPALTNKGACQSATGCSWVLKKCIAK